jgi:hypothetical protein
VKSWLSTFGKGTCQLGILGHSIDHTVPKNVLYTLSLYDS